GGCRAGLQVVVPCVRPALWGRNTNAPHMMIGEKGAAMTLGKCYPFGCFCQVAAPGTRPWRPLGRPGAPDLRSSRFPAESPTFHVEHGNFLPEALSKPLTGPRSVFRCFSLPQGAGTSFGHV